MSVSKEAMLIYVSYVCLCNETTHFRIPYKLEQLVEVCITSKTFPVNVQNFRHNSITSNCTEEKFSILNYALCI